MLKKKILMKGMMLSYLINFQVVRYTRSKNSEHTKFIQILIKTTFTLKYVITYLKEIEL